MPGSFVSPSMGVPGTIGLPAVRGFPLIGITVTDQTFILSGVTRDAQGNVLGGCIVDLFMTDTDKITKSMVSDPTTGVFSFAVQPLVNYYVVAYKAGAPDVAGTTVNTLTGT